MNIYQHRDYPWLVEEKRAIRKLLEDRIPVLGICLGAQLLADALGARVVQNPEYELGWWQIEFTPEARQKFPDLPERETVFHWHGDTFSLPSGAVRLARNACCGEQGFLFSDFVIGLQFHPELTAELLEDFLGGDASALPQGKRVQSSESMRKSAEEFLPLAQPLLVPMLATLFPPQGA